jgi:hypothetical protein
MSYVPTKHLGRRYWLRVSLLFPFFLILLFNCVLTYCHSFLLSSFFCTNKDPLLWPQFTSPFKFSWFYSEFRTNGPNEVRYSIQLSQLESKIGKFQELEIQMGESRMLWFVQGMNHCGTVSRDKHLGYSCSSSALSFPKAVQTFFSSKSF